ncbi:Asp-tRNA(Asn)/Glu-tRNA(Gln) amidotransferase subunit GatC [Fructobacillus fructosus]|uniref:Aspartyl/glutamyl-tRNA(Asn/Gln) amidotransferase subunit C n=1 Tax=Fructobacillus fructosus TaxID=1631 RepID=A0ABM9MXX0_9LACO|nr:Asp-tRNA(Asn)/Glu-tRNA(Gln) amidotransferase subunit GatC [Fructobacillus fructosus]MBD9364923.1 Asp-tRNA(Asn)/Glu-tRNA(Gln) amidotransferase subunit GatC [Leuconostoc mesenteroides]KRN51865.1 aspartyl glutamyl-tRNA(asn Gln) amidotransferase subunit C [Fructobacillus fructosus KCTC 3544]MBC9118446.1 Asp-tRNA(Asn)/Glu-tRNA(Gln) amidotransferase subunit GatC [Fructobacillus fructosus]MCK8638703.1 Asp-tRNA(Asn)/Glu-tRNA(Gln) amidotransferase subunit GatC [Fructobacillus fructosus]CAK1224471.1 
MATSISKEEVAHVADLAKLTFTDEELEAYTSQLQDIVSLVDKMAEVDTDGVAPTFSVTRNVNHLREDKAENWHEKKALLKQAPEEAADLIKVPAILQGGEEA